MIQCTLNKEDFFPIRETSGALHLSGVCSTCNRMIGHHEPRRPPFFSPQWLQSTERNSIDSKPEAYRDMFSPNFSNAVDQTRTEERGALLAFKIRDREHRSLDDLVIDSGESSADGIVREKVLGVDHMALGYNDVNTIDIGFGIFLLDTSAGGEAEKLSEYANRIIVGANGESHVITETSIAGIFPALPEPHIQLLRFSTPDTFREMLQMRFLSVQNETDKVLVIAIASADISVIWKQPHIPPKPKYSEALGSLFGWLSDDWRVLGGYVPDESLVSRLSSDGYSSLRDLCRPPPPRPLPVSSSRESLYDIYSRVPTKTPGRLEVGPSPLSIPTDIVREVMKYLTATDLYHLSCSHSFFKAQAVRIIPGLKLTLHSHQLASVWWMIDQERSPLIQPSPSLCTLFERTLVSRCAGLWVHHEQAASPCLRLYFDCAQQDIELTQPSLSYRYSSGELCLALNGKQPQREGVRGGLLCDEPGLGKTVTMLAVILRSLGTISTPPQNGDSTVARDDPVSPVLLCRATSAATSSEGPKVQQRESIHLQQHVHISTSITVGKVPEGTAMGLRSPHARKRSIAHSLHTLLPSQCSLIIVPEPLLGHWQHQIHSHLSVPFDMFVDANPTRPLPSAELLASCAVMITTFRRLAVEWRRGKPKCRMDIKPLTYGDEFLLPKPSPSKGNEPGTKRRRTSSGPVQVARNIEDIDSADVSELLKVYWLRIIVDEGHQMGRPDCTSALQMSALLEGERRWILTGTPTPSLPTASVSTVLKHIFHMLRFLRHSPLSAPEGERLWRQCVSRPLEKHELPVGMAPVLNAAEERVRLRPADGFARILAQVMVRHCKEEIADIPRPVWRVTILPLNEIEAASYNAVIAVLCGREGLLAFEGETPGFLTEPKEQAGVARRSKLACYIDDICLSDIYRKHCMLVLKNIRTACCGGGFAHLTLTPFESSRYFTLSMLRDQLLVLQNYQHSRCHSQALTDAEIIERLNKVSRMICDAVDGTLTPCEWCGLSLMKLCVTPCGHLFCSDCLDVMGDYCEKCKLYYNWNMYQLMEPGFEPIDYNFLYGVDKRVLLNYHRPVDLVREVPTQPSMPAHAAPAPPAPSSSSSSSSSLGATPPFSSSVGYTDNNRWMPADSRVTLPMRIETTSRHPSQYLRHPVVEEGIRSSKTAYLLSKIAALEEEYSEKLSAFERSSRCGGASAWHVQPPIVPKIIVFSEYFEFLDRVAIDLIEVSVKHKFFYGSNKAQNLNLFRLVPDIRVLLLSRSGAHGLDLSFATHIFLMDCVMDESLLSQVVSRAYRMGCKQSVQVEELIMKDTIEEVIHRERSSLRSAFTSTPSLTNSSSAKSSHSVSKRKDIHTNDTAEDNDRGHGGEVATSILHLLLRSLVLVRPLSGPGCRGISEEDCTREHPHGYGLHNHLKTGSE